MTQIAQWRYHEGIGYGTIADRLNNDPERFPPPEPPGRTRARGAWGKTSVYEILKNPKYTGYQVFNRRASRSRHGKVNDPALWVWSDEPVHEPLIPRWMFDQLAERRLARRGSRDGNEPNTHRQTARTYLLRGLAVCFCGRRLEGVTRQERLYYRCWPRANNRGRPDTYEPHPKIIYVREERLLHALAAFYADRVFGPDRRDLLRSELAVGQDHEADQREEERRRLAGRLAEVERRQAAVLRQAETRDPDDPFSRGLRQTYNALETERTSIHEALNALRQAGDPIPRRPEAQVEMLDALPLLALDLAGAPEPLLRDLFITTQLKITLTARDRAEVSITLPADRIDAASSTAQLLAPSTSGSLTRGNSAKRVDAVRAPSGIRTASTPAGR